VLKDRLTAVMPNGGTAIYDAVAKSAEMFDRRSRPRAALVVISDGADTASDRSLQQARDAVIKRDAFVYAIAIDSPGVSASTRVNPAALRDLTGPTGGYTEVVHDATELGPATQRIAEELNSQYTIGYTPSRALDGAWRSIRVRVKGQPYYVRARQGYMAERGSFR
jgi:Ca-activated chloride channel family protein